MYYTGNYGKWRSLPPDLTFVEEWEGEAALDTHLASVREQVPIAKLEGLIAAPPDIRRYSILAAIPTIPLAES